MTLRRAARVAFTAFLVLSLVVLFSPGSDVPSVQVSDKLVHFLLFAGLGVTGCLAGLWPVRLLVALVVYAGASEILQAVLPIDRDGDLRDALADSLGVLTGVGVGLGVLGLAAHRNRRVGT